MNAYVFNHGRIQPTLDNTFITTDTCLGEDVLKSSSRRLEDAFP